MWILESRGDFFQGRRMWLKPGKQYLFGRVKNNGVQFALSYKTVSRKHFVISIDEVQDGDVGNTHARSKITIIDQKSKTGTVVNGDLIKDSSRDLTLVENVVRVGGCDEEIIVRWQPCVLTFHLLKKEIRAGVLRTKQERVKDLDIKAVSEFISGTTTHLVANKRNTAKGLQALINGKWLVADSYIDALEYAATPADLDEEEHLSPLEQDFDRAWPDPASHLPPAGKEPTSRPADSYRPNARRYNMFESFTFVFGDTAQYENLLPPITAGHGKALLYKVVPNETTSDDMVVYLQNTAGRKGFGDVQRATDKGGVILVRWTDANNSQWVNELINQVALKLDQRAIDQSEFLDAILAVNASTLRQTIPYESDREGLMAPPATAASRRSIAQSSQALTAHDRQTQQHNQRGPDETAETNNPTLMEADSRYNSSHDHDNTSNSSHEQDETSVPRSRSAPKPLKAGRIIDFDDDFDPDAIVPFEDSEEDGREDVNTGTHPQQARSQDVSQDGSTTTNGRHGQTAARDSPSSRKRPHSSLNNTQDSLNDNDMDDLDDLLPAAAAMKRRKLMDGSHTKPGKTPASNKSTAGIILPAFRTREVREIDIKQEMKAKRTAERNATEAAENDDTNMIQLDESGNLPVYDVTTELVDVPLRKMVLSEANGTQSDRWDPKWNGRKNFKAFRRARARSDDTDEDDRRGPRARVIVPLVDAPKTTYGIGDQYWDKPEEDKERERARKKRASYRNTQSQNHSSANQASTTSGTQDQTVYDSDDEDDDHGHHERLDNPSPSVIRLQQEAASIVDHSVVIDESRRTRGDDIRDMEARTQKTTQAQSETESGRGPKRPASTGGDKGRISKRQKTLPVTNVHGSDSESENSDDMKFKFGRGRRARAKA